MFISCSSLVTTTEQDNNHDFVLFILLESSTNGQLNTLKQLLELGVGANVDIRNKNGSTALKLAMRSNYVQVVKELLEKGANVY